MSTGKKTFRSTENPALHFITLSDVKNTLPQNTPSHNIDSEAIGEPYDVSGETLAISNQSRSMDALQAFPSTSDETISKIERSSRERRTKRFSLAVPPSLFDDLSAAAACRRTNVNNLCVEILTRYVGKNQTQIRRFLALTEETKESETVDENS